MVQTAQAPVALFSLLGETDPDDSLTPLKDKQGAVVEIFILARRTTRVRMATCSHRQDVAVTSPPLHLGGTIFVHKKDEGWPWNGTTWALHLFILKVNLNKILYHFPMKLKLHWAFHSSAAVHAFLAGVRADSINGFYSFPRFTLSYSIRTLMKCFHCNK